MVSHAVCPRIKLFNPNIRDRNIVNFGECPTNDHREVLMRVENKNSKMPLDVSFT